MNLWRWAALGGVAVFIFMMIFPTIAGLHACTVAPDPIVALEMALSPAAVAALFPEPCKASLIAAQMQGLRIDTFGFIPVYAAFLIVSAIAVGRISPPSGRALLKPAIVLTILVAICDLIENSRMYAIIGDLPGSRGEIDVLMVAARAKFVLLGVVLMLIGIMHVKSSGWQRWLGIATVVGGPLCAVAVFTNQELMPLGASLAWFSLLIITFLCALRSPLSWLESRQASSLKLPTAS